MQIQIFDQNLTFFLQNICSWAAGEVSNYRTGSQVSAHLMKQNKSPGMISALKDS